MGRILKFVSHQMQTNNMLQAAIIAGPVAVVVNNLKEAPNNLWEYVKRNSQLELRFNSDMEYFSRVLEFVTKEVATQQKLRSFKYSQEEVWQRGDSWTQRTLSLGYGKHTGRWRSYRCTVDFSQDESPPGSSSDKETLKIVFRSRGQRVVYDFIDSLTQYLDEDHREKRIDLHLNGEHGWRKSGKLVPRPLSTVLTNERQGERALQHIRHFESQRDWYRQRGLPHHTGILLDGIPGTGKTSLVCALASETERSLFYLNLGAIKQESDLVALFSDGIDWRKSILVLEDIDTSGASVRRDQKGTVTLSTLLNVLDGIMSPDGLVVLATTNHPESLDPALIRPGRFDLHLSLGPLEWEQFVGLTQLFQLDQEGVSKLRASYTPTPGATLRGLIIQKGLQGLLEHFEQAAVN